MVNRNNKQIERGMNMFEICCGSKETMQNIINSGGLKALNPKTMKWQIIDTNVDYQIRVDKTIPDTESETGFTDCVTLLCNKDLYQIAKDKGLL